MAAVSKYRTSSGATLYRVRYYTPDRGETQKRGFKTKRDAELFGLELVPGYEEEHQPPEDRPGADERKGHLALEAPACCREHAASRVVVDDIGLVDRLLERRGQPS